MFIHFSRTGYPATAAGFLIVTLLLSVVSCRKEYSPQPDKTLKHFIITDGKGETLKAAINGQNIILYWPPFQLLPDSATPSIAISEKASIHPASGAKIALNEKTTYTITAQDGSQSMYKLVIAVNQPPLIINQVYDAMKIGGEFEITGEYFLPDTNHTKLFLLNKQGKAFQLAGNNFTAFTHSRISTQIPLSAELDSGYYSIKLVSGSRQLIKGTYHIAKPDLVFTLPSQPAIIKKTEKLIFVTSAVIGRFYDLTAIKTVLLMTDMGDIIPAKSFYEGNSVSVEIPGDIAGGTQIIGVIFAEDGGDPLSTWQDLLHPILVSD